MGLAGRAPSCSKPLRNPRTRKIECPRKSLAGSRRVRGHCKGKEAVAKATVGILFASKTCEHHRARTLGVTEMVLIHICHLSSSMSLAKAMGPLPCSLGPRRIRPMPAKNSCKGLLQWCSHSGFLVLYQQAVLFNAVFLRAAQLRADVSASVPKLEKLAIPSCVTCGFVVALVSCDVSE